jgi:hypothetical protein
LWDCGYWGCEREYEGEWVLCEWEHEGDASGPELVDGELSPTTDVEEDEGDEGEAEAGEANDRCTRRAWISRVGDASHSPSWGRETLDSSMPSRSDGEESPTGDVVVVGSLPVTATACGARMRQP